MWTGIRAALLVVFCFGVASQAMAGKDDDQDREQTRALKGVYRGSISTNCMESVGGFTPNLMFQLNGFAVQYSETMLSTAVFAGDGTMTETVRGTTYFHQEASIPGNLGAGTFESTCRYDVNVKANKAVVLKGSCKGNALLGPAAGLGSAVDNVVSRGQVSEDGSIIIFASPEPVPQVLTLSSGYVAQRLCSNNSTYIRVR
jgi:hypothetical protein